MAKEKLSGKKMAIIEAAVELCVPTKGNPRGKIDESSERFLDLVESVKAGGVRIPVHARPINGNKLEVLAGARRLRASQVAGRTTIPAIVHHEMSFDDAIELTLLENFEREDLTPSEEVRAVEMLIRHFDGDVHRVAEKLGKTERWVRLRRKLDDLADVWREQMMDPKGDFATWSISHFGLIAALPEKVQIDLNGNSWLFDPGMSVKDLDKVIKQRSHLLKGAPWALDDLQLVKKAGACTSCSKRSACQGVLFHDDITPEALARDDRCLDIACWDKKASAWKKRKVAEAVKKNPDIPKISCGCARAKDVFSCYQWESAKKSDADAVEAVIIDGSDEGKTTHVRLKSKTPAGANSSSSHDSHNSPKSRLLRMRDDLKFRREYYVAKKIIAAMKKASEPEQDITVRLALLIGCDRIPWTKIVSVSSKALISLLWKAVLKESTGCGAYQFRRIVRGKVASDVCQYFGLDAKALRKEASAKISPSKEMVKLEEEVTGKKRVAKGKAPKAKTAKKTAAKKRTRMKK